MRPSRINWPDPEGKGRSLKIWSVLRGCSPVSESCGRCWARAWHRRFRKDTEIAKWEGHIEFHPELLTEPVREKKPAVVLVALMSDIFHENVKPEWIDSILEVIAASPQHCFMFLTKRPQNIRMKLNLDNYLSNLWIGATAETQAHYNWRWPLLCKSWQGKKFVSVEPMLSSVNIYAPITPDFAKRPDLVIAGPETGPGARPCGLIDRNQLEYDCKAMGVSYYWKGEI